MAVIKYLVKKWYFLPVGGDCADGAFAAPERASNQRKSGRVVYCARLSVKADKGQGPLKTMLSKLLENALPVVKLYINESQ